MRVVRAGLVLALGVLAAPGSADPATRRAVAGYVETVMVTPGRLLLAAKLDTGADSSSIDVTELRTFLRDGDAWVSFRIEDRRGGFEVVERPVVRTARIRNLDGDALERPVVMLGICLGTYQAQTPVSLASRKGFRYPLLLGRAFLAGRFLVDPALTDTAGPDCDAHGG